jgi:tetratricopeptide (TPR) repeat protein
MKTKYIIILFLLFSFTAIGQQKEIDSLKQVLKTKQSDTSRVMTLNTLAFLYHDSKPDTSMVLANQAKEIANHIDYKFGIADALGIKSAAYGTLSDFPNSLYYNLEALQLYEELENTFKIAVTYNNTGMIYGDMGDHQKALANFLKALRIGENLERLDFKSVLTANIGETYLQLGKLDSAQIYLLESYKFAVQSNDSYSLRGISLNLGNLNRKLKKNVLAMEYYRGSYKPTAIDLPNAISTIGIAELFKNQKKSDSALHYAQKSYDISTTIGYIPYILRSSKFLADHYKAAGNRDSSLVYLEKTLMAKDSLYDQEKRNKLQSLAIQENLRQQEITTAKLNAEKNEKLNLQYLGITAGIVIFILIFILLSRSIIISEKWLSFLGVLILLLVFEFINLYLAPIISQSTNNSPVYTLLIMVGIAGVLVPLHAKVENYISKKLVKKNQKIKLEAARKTIQRLEGEKLS